MVLMVTMVVVVICVLEGGRERHKTNKQTIRDRQADREKNRERDRQNARQTGEELNCFCSFYKQDPRAGSQYGTNQTGHSSYSWGDAWCNG